MARHVFLAAPHANRQIAGDLVEEVRLVHCIILQQELLLCLVLAVSEVRVVGEGEALLEREASEGDVALDFVIFGQFESTVGANLTVILDRHHCVKKTILFDQTTVNDALCWVLRRCVLQWIPFLLLCILSSCRFRRRIGLILHLDVNVAAVALERPHQLIILILVQRVHIAELSEDKIVRRCEVESFRRELILLGIRNSHCDVVVCAQSADPAPE